MKYEFLFLHIKDSVCTITLNRPEVFNALNTGILKELSKVILELSENENVRGIVLTGSGDKAFCSGADLKEGLSNSNVSLGETLKENYEPLILAMRNCPKPIVCQLNGVAAGAGMSLALACDIIIGDENTYMTELFVGIGLMPDAGSMFFLPRIVGFQKAFEIFSTGRKIYMKEALDLGLVSKIVPKDKLGVTVSDLMKYYATAPTFAIGQMKKVLNQVSHLSLKEVMDLEAEGQTKCGFSNDFKEGVGAFIQKRQPQFKGN